MKTIKKFNEFVNEEKNEFLGDKSILSDFKSREFSITRDDNGLLKFDFDSVGWLFDTNDVAEGVAIICTAKKYKKNEEIKKIQITDKDKENINPKDALYWLTGGSKEWKGGDNYDISWEEIEDKLVKENGQKIIDTVNNCNTLGELIDIFDDDDFKNDIILHIGNHLNPGDTSSKMFIEVGDWGDRQFYSRDFGVATVNDNKKIPLICIAQIQDLEDAISEEELKDLFGKQFMLDITVIPELDYLSKKIKKETNNDIGEIFGYYSGLKYKPNEEAYFKTQEEAEQYLMSDKLNKQITVDGININNLLIKPYNSAGNINLQILNFLIGKTKSMFENKTIKNFEDFVNEKFDTEKRKELAKKGFACKDGSYPIEHENDLINAIKDQGRGLKEATPERKKEVLALIYRRAKDFGIKLQKSDKGYWETVKEEK